MKTIKKVYYDEFHYRKVFDQPSPPLDRLAASGFLPKARIDQLLKLRDETDLMELRNQIAYLVDKLFGIKKATSDSPVNIYDTL